MSKTVIERLPKLMGALLATGTVALAPVPAALAASGGDANAGDVWTDNVGQPAGPGHEQDPHLACTDINLWGAGMADAAGSYTIDGWAPSGHQEMDYSSTWTYDKGKGGTQVISVIPIKTLIANAVANGDTPQAQQGFHFKVQLAQDPQKHKTFWVNCPVPPPSHGTPGPGSPGGKTPPPAVTPPASTPPASAPAGSGPRTPDAVHGGTKRAVNAVHKHRKHRKLVHPKRHLRPDRAPKGVGDAAPAFTG